MKLHLLGCASGMAGADIGSGNGPLTMKESALLNTLSVPVVWKDMLTGVPGREMDKAVSALCTALAKQTAKLTRDQSFFSVLGGDHSCAIGTWSGVYDAKCKEGEIGLIWIDAHMDSHTPDTSETGRLHGMPLAALMGHGYPALTEILNKQPKFKPENVCLIGVRSYESGEADLLKRLNVKVYFMDEVKQRGFDAVLQEAVLRVSQQTVGYGVSLDLDGVDPLDAPGVDVPEPDGIRALDLQEGLTAIAHDPRLIAVEIVEFDPQYDEDQKTEQLVVSILEILAQGKKAYGDKA